MTTIGGIDPNFTGLATSGDPPYVRLPDPSTLFSRRARRFAVVAVDNEIAEYLGFLAALSTAQQDVATRIPPPALPAGVGTSIEHGMPPLSRDLASLPGAIQCFDALLQDLMAAQLGDGPAQAVLSLSGAPADDRVRMLQAVADGTFEIERLAENALAAAALQVWYALHAAQLDASVLRNIGENLCPCCGGAPSSSTVVQWPDAQGGRYLTCSLCCAMWNHVRVKCTACGATKGISYRSVEGSTGDIAAEVCDTCRGYAKHLVISKNAALDPVADDVASYGLDIMLRDDGWHRTGLNPFLILT